MDTLASALPTFNLQEPIPGYHLRERIGAGGYGEVWLADAPGGLAKAIKIVYGPLKAGRAERELKSLNRIKQVQHPLLLSLERIEMVDEHLIIVMELAHGSLKERFEACVAEGERGIPRGELLAYLRDVADALDYLYEEHSLQHLDVKPENLLLIAKRVKVADFGLVKDLGDSSESLVGGLTPLYAPPEVFDGRPNRNSDQYSLAMVYQELLTGEPPFAGRTVAQLAAQHLHSSPCLASLPRTDQPVIARALSKDPNRRFPSCRALVDSLTEAPKATAHVRRTVTESSRITPTSEVTAFGSPSDPNDAKGITFPVANDIQYLPPLDVPTPDAATFRPSVFIGVGGTGAAVLRSLRLKLSERFGNVDDIPALQMLLLDTDATALNLAARGERTTALRSGQLVPLTLRQPQEYRGDATTLLEWLNRRWLFNIPRSLTTEGIRPLGRLALIDHFEPLANALHHALSSVMTEESIQASSTATGLNFVKTAPRIFVVASMAGGVGSGLVLDLGYLLRTMLEEMKISDEQLHGVLVHSTSRRTSQRDLALANSLSLLTELHHYTSDKGYPGEPACKLPPRVVDSAAFRHTYVAHLGDELSEEEFHAGTADLGEYLYQNSVTNAATFFDQFREALRDVPNSPRNGIAHADTVRTIGLVQVGGTHGEAVNDEANALCQTLIARWAGRRLGTSDLEASLTIDPEIVGVAKKFANGMDLRVDKLFAWVHDLFARQLMESPDTYVRRSVNGILEQVASSESCERIDTAKAAVESTLFGDESDDESLRSCILGKVALAATAKRESLRDWFFILVNAPRSRVQGARDAVRWYQDLLAELESKVRQSQQELDGPVEVAEKPDELQIVHDFAMRELRKFCHKAVLQLLRELKIEVIHCEEQLREFARRLLHLGNEFITPKRADSNEADELVRSLKEHHLELAKQLDRELTPALVRKQMSLSDLLNANSDVWTNLVSTMRTTARRLAGTVAGRMQVSNLIGEAEARFGDGPRTVAEAVEFATPRLHGCGGDCRYLLIAPNSTGTQDANWKQRFDESVNSSMNFVTGNDTSLVVCCESQRVPLQNVAAHLVGSRRDLVKVAGRLHTRIDVEWPSLESWLDERPSGPAISRAAK